jgi:hypothetical protein
LEVTTLLSSSELTTADFQIAFFIVSGVSLTALIPLLMLKRNAGSNVSGHTATGPGA